MSPPAFPDHTASAALRPHTSSRTMLSKQSGNRLTIRWHGHPGFRNNAPDVPGRRDIKGGVGHFYLWRDNRLYPDLSDFLTGALLNRDLGTRGKRPVNGRQGRRHIKRNLMLFGKNGHTIGADLVGHIAIRRNP